jgi:hypothetical protein
MSEARLGDMAVIDAALINPRSLDPGDIEARKSLIESDNDPVTGQDQHEALSSPITEIVKELSGEEQEAAKEQGTDEKGQLVLKSKQQSLLKQKLQDTGQSASRAAGSIRNGLDRTPLPGGLLAPLLIIIVLSMLLVKYNGHTRFTWLWLVATQNAALPGGQGGEGGEETASETAVPANVVPFTPFLPLDIDEW